MNSEAESTVGTNLNNVRDYIETDNLESQSTENQHWKASGRSRGLTAIKVVLPHVGLVTFVCIYALVGAWIFYSLESPHEDRLKTKGIRLVQRIRKELATSVWQQHQSGHLDVRNWKFELRQKLHNFNENIYKAYKEQYVRYGDIKNIHNSSTSATPRRVKRHWSAKGRSSERGGKLWTASSALFFAATTMATIGYGNIVPVTSRGRVACIVFALFGAPLAIITIGDLGKFLSECTIWFYQKLKKAFRSNRNRFRKLKMAIGRRRQRGMFVKLDSLMTEFGLNDDGRTNDQNEDTKDAIADWEEEKTEVPVLFVFAILLIYIALGGVLFAFLESWTYMDAFYYCFVSLTTIGFGDLVPERHEYIVLMLVYLGVGLAVTTMCIDLVGIQYIQKIHYFGRKFKGTDILQILRRKRMLERRFAMGEGKEFIEFMIQVQQQEKLILQPHPPRQLTPLIPPVRMASQQYFRDEHDEKLSLQSEHELIPFRLDDQLVSEGFLQAAQTPIPKILEAPPLPSSPPPLSTPSEATEATSSASARLLMHAMDRKSSWLESGPSLSVRCSLSTEPSVGNRLICERLDSRQPSVTSFAFNFPAPSPDLKKIAEYVKGERRRESCPPAPRQIPSPPIELLEISANPNEIDTIPFEVERPEPPSPEPPPQDPKPSIVLPPPKFGRMEELSDPSPGLIACELQTSASAALQEHAKSERIQNEILDVPASQLRNLSPEQHCHIQHHWLPPETVSIALEALDAWLDSEDGGELIGEQFVEDSQAQKQLVAASWHSEVLSTAFLHHVPYPIVRPPSAEERPVDEGEGSERVDDEETSTSSEPVFDLDLGAFELVDAGISAEELLSNEDPVIYHKDIPVHSVHHDTVQTEAAIENLMNAPASMLSSQAPPIMVADNYCFAVDGDRIQMDDILGDDQHWRHTSRPTKFFYTRDLRRFYRVNCLHVKGRIVSARLAAIRPAMGGGNATEAAATATMSSGGNGEYGSIGSSFSMGPTFMSPPLPRRPSAYPGTSLTTPTASPQRRRRLNPSLVREAASEHIDPSSHPGTVASSSFPSFSATPRESMAAHSLHGATYRSEIQMGETVDLTSVYKVARIYSFWRSCTSFHRIVTVIERVGGETTSPFSSKGVKAFDSQSERIHPRLASRESWSAQSDSAAATSSNQDIESKNFRRRLFVQYLWRNVKPNEKSRVQKEFDPRRQRLLQAVTDTAARKRMTGAWRTSSPAGFSPSRSSPRRFPSLGRGEQLNVGTRPLSLPRTPSPSPLKRTKTTAGIASKQNP